MAMGQLLRTLQTHVHNIYPEIVLDTVDDAACRWLIAEHEHYGVVGGLCLHSDPLALSKMLPSTSKQFTKHNGWLATHLYFHLEDDVMQSMNDQQLNVFMKSFYKSLYENLAKIRDIFAVPYFCFIIDGDQHRAAQIIGLIPFENQLLLNKYHEYEAANQNLF